MNEEGKWEGFFLTTVYVYEMANCRGDVDGCRAFEWMLLSSVVRGGAGLYGVWSCSRLWDEYWGIVDLGRRGRRHKSVLWLGDFLEVVDRSPCEGISEAIYSVWIGKYGSFSRRGIFIEWCKCVRLQCSGSRKYNATLTISLAVRRAVKKAAVERLVYKDLVGVGYTSGDVRKVDGINCKRAYIE